MTAVVSRLAATLAKHRAEGRGCTGCDWMWVQPPGGASVTSELLARDRAHAAHVAAVIASADDLAVISLPKGTITDGVSPRGWGVVRRACRGRYDPAPTRSGSCPHTDHRDCRGDAVTETLALTERPTVRLWDKNFNYVAGCELLGPPKRAGDGWLRIRIPMDSDVAQALLRDETFSLDNITVDLPAGRLCGRMSQWSTGDALMITAQDISTGLARHIIPPAPPVHSLPPEPGPVVVTPDDVQQLATRIIEALRATNDGDAYIGELYRGQDGDSPSEDYLGVHGPVDFRRIAAYLLTHPKD